MNRRVKKFNIERNTERNTYYRTVVYTNPQMQIVLMSLKPGDTIPREKHTRTTQFIRIESGRGFAFVDDVRYTLNEGDCLVVPRGVWHEISQTGRDELKLYTIYVPPEHPPTRKQKNQPI
jgi:mannose-6-phosphate isomerase-like protein (cupin superfamily)